MKAADISDRDFLTWVRDTPGTPTGHWVMRWDIEEAHPQYPWKVLLAKARKLIDRGLMDGCSCGCRGDYVLTDKGNAFLSS